MANNKQAILKLYNMTNKLPISATIITLNEERDIEKLLKSLHFVDEIILVDSYSTDKTVEIAKKYTDKVYLREFKNFSDQRNFALSKATNKWIMRVDGDEAITPELEEKIRDIVKKDDGSTKKCYMVKWKFRFMNGNLKYSQIGNHYVHFLMNNNDFQYRKAVHESPDIPDWESVKIKGVRLYHDTFKSTERYIEKMNLYSSLRTKDLLKKNPNVTMGLLFKPTYRFFYHFIMNLGFLDGFPGYMFAKMQALECRLRFIKFREFKENNSKDLSEK